MILDNEQQRAFLLKLFEQCQFPGVVLDTAYEVKRAIAEAKVIAQPGAGDGIAN